MVHPSPPSQPDATLDARPDPSPVPIVTVPIVTVPIITVPSSQDIFAVVGQTIRQVDVQTPASTTLCLRGQPRTESGPEASNAVVDHGGRMVVSRDQHPGVFKGIHQIEVNTQGRAVVHLPMAAPVEMTLQLCKGGWRVYCGWVQRGSRTTRKGYLCRICYTDYLGKTSYNDIQENCPACFLRLYDLSNKFRAARRCASTTRTHASTAIKPNVSSAVHPCSVEDRGFGSAASAVAITSLPAHTGLTGGPYPRHTVYRRRTAARHTVYRRRTAAIRRIVQYLNLRFPDCLDVLYVPLNFSEYVFLRNGTRQTTGRRIIGIVEYEKNRQLKWGVLKHFRVPGEIEFTYDGIQPVNSVLCKYLEASSASATATTTCEYFSSTWVPQPRAIIAALKLTGFDDARINGVYVFAGYRPRTSGKKRNAKRNQDSAYFQSTSGLRLFPDDMGIWHVCSDDRVLASSSNIKPAWNPGKPSLDKGWILRDPTHNAVTNGWSVLGVSAEETRYNKSLNSKCRALSPEEEYALTGDNLRAIIEMKTLHVLGVAMGGEREFNCKYLQWNPKAGSKKQNENDRMKTLQVRLATHGWKDAVLRRRVGDFVFVENTHLTRLRAAGSKIFVLHPDETFLCYGRMHLPHSQFFVVRLLNSDIPHADGSERNSWPSKRGSSGSCSRDNVKRSRQ